MHAHTLGGTSLDEGSGRRRDFACNTQHSQKTDIHAPGGIRVRNASKQAASDLHLRPNIHKRGREGEGERERERSMPSAGFVPAIPTSEWLQTYVLKRAAAGIGLLTD